VAFRGGKAFRWEVEEASRLAYRPLGAFRKAQLKTQTEKKGNPPKSSHVKVGENSGESQVLEEKNHSSTTNVVKDWRGRDGKTLTGEERNMLT